MKQKLNIYCILHLYKEQKNFSTVNLFVGVSRVHLWGHRTDGDLGGWATRRGRRVLRELPGTTVPKMRSVALGEIEKIGRILGN